MNIQGTLGESSQWMEEGTVAGLENKYPTVLPYHGMVEAACRFEMDGLREWLYRAIHRYTQRNA